MLFVSQVLIMILPNLLCPKSFAGYLSCAYINSPPPFMLYFFLTIYFQYSFYISHFDFFFSLNCLLFFFLPYLNVYQKKKKIPCDSFSFMWVTLPKYFLFLTSSKLSDNVLSFCCCFFFK